MLENFINCGVNDDQLNYTYVACVAVKSSSTYLLQTHSVKRTCMHGVHTYIDLPTGNYN